MAEGTAASPIALLVEDEALVAMVAEDYLSELGFRVRAAATAEQALKAMTAEDYLPDLAVVDIGLPDMRGDALVPHLRRLAPTLKIVIASGHDPAALRETFADDEDLIVVGKPYSEDDLVRAVRLLGFS